MFIDADDAVDGGLQQRMHARVATRRDRPIQEEPAHWHFVTFMARQHERSNIPALRHTVDAPPSYQNAEECTEVRPSINLLVVKSTVVAGDKFLCDVAGRCRLDAVSPTLLRSIERLVRRSHEAVRRLGIGPKSPPRRSRSLTEAATAPPRPSPGLAWPAPALHRRRFLAAE